MQVKSGAGKIPMNCRAFDPEEITINRPKTKAEIDRAYFSRQPVDKRRSRKGGKGY